MNNKNETLIKCKPSQLINLPVFLLTLAATPCLYLLNELIKQKDWQRLVPDPMEIHIQRLPGYLAVALILYLGYHILKIYCIRYEIDPEEFRYYSGILHRKHEFIENYRIKDFAVDRPLIYRLFGLGNLTIYTSDKTTPVFKMKAIKNPQKIYKALRQLVEQNRRAKHVFEVD